MKKLINFGVRPNYEPWEIFFTRKINLITLIGGFNVFLSYWVFPLFEIYDFQTEMLCMIFVTPLVFLMNRCLNYIAAAYTFYISSMILMFFLTAKMGIDSYVVIFFFPLVLSIIHLMGRKETFVHLIITLSGYMVCVLAIAVSFKYDFLSLHYPTESFKTLRIFVLVLSMATSFAFLAIITYESIKQEKLIKKMLREKEVLLAEVYHRVKNNMSIVTSLLNLKKNNSDSEEVKEALEACRSRVYSMSLVHQKFFSQKSLTGIDFTQYVKELILAVTHSFGERNEIEVEIEADDLYLDVTQAIPCGLILNELLTNSFKHAQPVSARLKIRMQLSYQDGVARIKISDNGIGFDPEKSMRQGSMGMELIHSLCEQLDAKCGYENKNGSHFTISFIPVKKR